MNDTSSIHIRRCERSEILDTRYRTIIVETDRPTPDFEGDEDSTTRHYGAFVEDECVGCLSFFLNEWEGKPAWQLRGMGVEARLRGRGVGTRLLDEAIEDLTRNPTVPRCWCNARKQAVGFYLKRRWEVASAEFEIEGVGPHLRMILTLEVENSQ